MKSFKKSTAQESFLNKVSGLRPVTLIKNRMFILLMLILGNVDKFSKLNRNRCFCEMFNFQRNCQKSYFYSKQFRDFLKNVGLQSSGNLWGNSDTRSMVIIAQFRFSCYEGKLCQNLKSFYMFCPRLHLFSRISPDERFCTFIDQFPEMP